MRGFASALEAARAAVAETTWPEATLVEIETNQWIARVDGRSVIRFRTMPNRDGTWEWLELEYC